MPNKRLQQIKVGDHVPVWLHMNTVLGEVVGFVSGKVVLKYTIHQLHADGWHEITKEFYRDRDHIERQWADLQRSKAGTV